ncbi:MAG: HyaD/HybD family hydrogenase maturation endopeptidase [Candidatus Levyibacteriota bacterium]
MNEGIQVTAAGGARYATSGMALPALVMGIGNVLQGDDGVGVHAIRRLQANLTGCDGLILCDAGTLGTTLLVEIEQAERLILLDAMRMAAPPGTVRCFVDADMDRWLRRVKAGSVHEVGLSELLDLARLRERLPERRALLGIEPGYIGWGDALSEPVAAALDDVERSVIALLRQWADGSTPGSGSALA